MFSVPNDANMLYIQSKRNMMLVVQLFEDLDDAYQ